MSAVLKSVIFNPFGVYEFADPEQIAPSAMASYRAKELQRGSRSLAGIRRAKNTAAHAKAWPKLDDCMGGFLNHFGWLDWVTTTGLYAARL
jgi:hypothetical protein